MMKSLFEVKPVDKKFYESKLKDFLPEKIIDFHTHVWKKTPLQTSLPRKAKIDWPSLVAAHNPIEDLIETYRLMLPDKQVTPLIFTDVYKDNRLSQKNAYIRQCALKHNFPSLIFALPQWGAKQLETSVRKGGFLGTKVYFNFAAPYIPSGEIRIFDYLPLHQLEVLNKHGWIAVLHIPRNGRLRDPVNLAQLLEIDRAFPKVKLVVAHVGRAYCKEDVGDALDVLKKTRNMMFDITANTNQWVFEKAIQAVGPKRILFGSDMPILRMRMRRIFEKGSYVNLVPKGLYGPLKDMSNMRAVAGKEAKNLTFFLYEEIDAFRRAAVKTGLGQKDIENVFHNNAKKLIDGARPKPIKRQLQMVWPNSKSRNLALPSTPKGYELRTIQAGDDAAYIRLMKSAGFKKWDCFSAVMRSALNNGIFFVVHKQSGSLVATAAAQHRPTAFHTFGAELGWLAVNPSHRGKQLGSLVSIAATKRLLNAGYSSIYLLTDDFRLEAIKTYLKLGWVPFVSEARMTERWQKICGQLGIEYSKIDVVTA